VLLVVVGVLGLLALWLVVRAQQAQSALEDARHGVTQIRDALTDGDTARASELLAVVQADTTRAEQLTGDPVFTVAGAVPVVGNTPDAVHAVATAANDLAYDVLPDLIGAGAALDPNGMRTSGDEINLEAFEVAAPLLDQSAEGLAAISSSVADIDTAATPAAVGDAVSSLQRQVDDTLKETRSAAAGATLLPPMLGADGDRRYFLAFQSNNEARGTGGFFGSYGIASAEAGKVRVEKLAPRSELDDQTYTSLPLDFGPDYEALYGDDPASWVGANISPHYPYAAQLWLQMWRDRTGEELDGAITTDPVTLSYLLEATGPVTLEDGRKITSKNVVAFTENEIYLLIPDDDVARDAYLQQISEAALEAVLSGRAEPRALVDALGRAAGERRLLIYSSHPDEQRVLETTSVAGVIPKDAAPFAGLATINGGGNKLDYYLGQQLDYQVVKCEPDGTRQTKIVVRFTNSAPDQGLPLYIDARSDLPLKPDGTLRDANGDHFFYAQVYATQGAVLQEATRDGKPLDVTQGAERGRPVFQAPVEVKAGDSTELVFQLREPATSGPVRTFVTPLVKPASVTADDSSCGSG
jgi:hypothetical protein